jgi:hypothetical protein
MHFPNIGAASFGGFAPETIHRMDDRRQITARRTPTRGGPRVAAHNCSRRVHWIGTGWFINPQVLVTAGGNAS